jgi:G3E family GTPase
MKLPIPVNIVTGPLGAGKSTCIASLVASKPAGARWCILVNEFGALGIDEAILSASNATEAGNIVVKQLAGGCMCCALSGPLNVAIAQTIRLTKPDRLIIEPSGLGHPAGILDVLRSEHLARVVDVKAVLCLVGACLRGCLAGCAARLRCCRSHHSQLARSQSPPPPLPPTCRWTPRASAPRSTRRARW